MVAIYARQSVDKKDSISIETQIELCKLELGQDERFQIYHDKGFSGSNTNRPAFQKMIAEIRAGKINRLIVYRLDRMSRSLLDFANLIDFLDRHNTSFVSTQEKFDTGTPMGRAMLSITMVFAQLERETIQIRIKDNYYARGEKGMYLGGPPPFGFSKIEERENGVRKKYLVPIPEEAEIIRQMFELYGIDQKTLGETARTLNGRGYESRTGKGWTSSKVSLTLRNPIYARSDIAVYQYYKEKGCKITGEPELFIGNNGCYLYGKRQGNERKYSTFQDHVLSLAPSDGLVDADLFLKCQRKLDGNIQFDNSSWGTITWLTGLVKCGKCGYAAIPKSSNSGRYYYFYCSGHPTGYCDVTHNLGSVREVERAVESKMMEVIHRYRAVHVEARRKTNQEANRLKSQIQICDNQIEKLIDLMLTAEEASGQYINQRIKKLDEQKKELEAKLKEVEATDSSMSEKSLTAFQKDWPTLEVRQKNELAKLLIYHIELARDSVTVFWKHHF